MFKHPFSIAYPQKGLHLGIVKFREVPLTPLVRVNSELIVDCGNCLYRNQLRIPGNLAKWMVGGQQNHAARGGHLPVQYLGKIFKQFVKNI